VNKVFILVCYDAPETRVRNRIINSCKSHGLLPAQYSVYGGELTQTRRKELIDEIKLILDKEEGHVIVIPIDKKMSEKLVSIGNPMVQSLTFWDEESKELVL